MHVVRMVAVKWFQKFAKIVEPQNKNNRIIAHVVEISGSLSMIMVVCWPNILRHG